MKNITAGKHPTPREVWYSISLCIDESTSETTSGLWEHNFSGTLANYMYSVKGNSNQENNHMQSMLYLGNADKFRLCSSQKKNSEDVMISMLNEFLFYSRTGL